MVMFQILLDGAEPCDAGTTQLSSPVCRRGGQAIGYRLWIKFVGQFLRYLITKTDSCDLLRRRLTMIYDLLGSIKSCRFVPLPRKPLVLICVEIGSQFSQKYLPCNVCCANFKKKTASLRRTSLKSDNRLLTYGQKRLSIWRPSAVKNIKIFIFGHVTVVGLQICCSCQISSKSDNFPLRYGDITIFKMAAVRHLGIVLPPYETRSLCCGLQLPVKFHVNLLH